MNNLMMTLNILLTVGYTLVLAEENPYSRGSFEFMSWLFPIFLAAINVLYLGSYKAPLEKAGEENIIRLWLKVKRKKLKEQL